MARRKKKTGFQAFIDNISFSGLLLHPATLFVGLNVFIAATAMYCWDKYQDKIVDQDALVLTADKIVINTPPVWTKTNLKEAILESSGKPKSLFDSDLINDAVTTLKTVGWIENVHRLEKSAEGLSVELSYREPVALVELHEKTVPGWKKNDQLIPVDRHGVVMPENLVVDDGSRPKIYVYHYDRESGKIPDHMKKILRWAIWPDERVTQAAAISNLLVQDWKALGLSRIISFKMIELANDHSQSFELWTDEGRNAATVIWGNAPGFEVAGEATALQKLVALRAYIQANGPLNKLSERKIDLKSGQAQLVAKSSNLEYRNAFTVRQHR